MIGFDVGGGGVESLRRLIKVLRSENGCPWDREQTHESIKRNLIEEAYEAAEAIETGDIDHLREELGDVLTQIIFHADIEEDAGHFNLDGVADATVQKLLYRHPHVFGDVSAETSDDVISNWDELKRREKSQLTVTDSLNAVAKSLPALWRAEKILKKAGKAGYGSISLEEAIAKAQELLKRNDNKAVGELLLLAVKFAVMHETDPEEALNAATDDFIASFSEIENV